MSFPKPGFFARALVATACIAFSGAFAQDNARSPVIEGLSKLIGGQWVGEVGPPDARMAVEFSYSWHPDKKGIVGVGVIGKGSAHPVHTHVTLGWDAKANKVYYLDTHNSDNVFYGHITQDGDAFRFEFGMIGGDPKAYRSATRFVSEDLMTSTIEDKDGKEIVKVQLKRVRSTEEK